MKSFSDNGIVQLYQADAREIPLLDQSVHCVVTSPPYFGLRVYQDNDDRGIGLEASVEAYVANLVDVFREVRRVLRDDGVCWVDLGDSYSSSPPGNTGISSTSGLHGVHDSQHYADGLTEQWKGHQGNTPITQGNRLGIPERVVMALQADGWTWRDTVIWAKKSAMPESVNGWRWERCRVKVGSQTVEHGHDSTDSREHLDESALARWSDCPGCPKCEANDGLVLRRGSWRTTSSHEYIYMLTKGMGYYCDAEAVKTVSAGQNGLAANFQRTTKDHLIPGQNAIQHRDDREPPSDNGKANRRSVWNDIRPEPYGGAHFATFPSDLPRICIQASTSEKGVCPECGSQWARVVAPASGGAAGKGSWVDHEQDRDHGKVASNTFVHSGNDAKTYQGPTTLGWRATCGHDANPVPATVLDPFCGTATTMLAAQKLGRRAVGVDISESYLKQAVKRLTGVTLPLV